MENYVINYQNLYGNSKLRNLIRSSIIMRVCAVDNDPQIILCHPKCVEHVLKKRFDIYHMALKQRDAYRDLLGDNVTVHLNGKVRIYCWYSV